VDFIQSMSKKEDFFIKIVLVGDANVGKTNLIKRFTLNEFDHSARSTVGLDSQFINITFGGKTAKVAIWDTAGMECHGANTQLHYRGTNGVIIVYDITDRKSYNHVTKWLDDVRKSCDNSDVIIMLVGNKHDMRHVRCVETEEAEVFAAENQVLFLETSACDGTNVKLAFNTVIENTIQARTMQEMNEQLPRNHPGNHVRLKHNTTKKKRGCCKT